MPLLISMQLCQIQKDLGSSSMLHVEGSSWDQKGSPMSAKSWKGFLRILQLWLLHKPIRKFFLVHPDLKRKRHVFSGFSEVAAMPWLNNKLPHGFKEIGFENCLWRKYEYQQCFFKRIFTWRWAEYFINFLLCTKPTYVYVENGMFALEDLF